MRFEIQERVKCRKLVCEAGLTGFELDLKGTVLSVRLLDRHEMRRTYHCKVASGMERNTKMEEVVELAMNFA